MLANRLFSLQQVDSALDRLRAQRAALDDGAGLRVQAAEATSRLERLHGELAEGQRRQRALDLEIQSLRERRRKLDADLYSGRIRNPKELEAMQDDLAALGRLQTTREDEVLQVMEQVETLEAQARDAERARIEIETALARAVEAYARAAETIDREIAALDERRAALAAELDEEVLRRYERLRPAKAGLAVAVVHRGVCQGCHVTVSQRIASRLERDTDALVTCEGCGRILVLGPEGER